MSLNEDPFNAMMSTLESQLKSLRAKFDAYRVRVESSDSSDAACKAATAELRAEVAQGSSACAKMRGVLGHVEQAREKYAHIDERELATRRAYVERLEAVREGEDAPRARAAPRERSLPAPCGPIALHHPPSTPTRTHPAARARADCAQNTRRV